jgi:hypothetical protein
VKADSNSNHAADITNLAIFNKKDGKIYVVVTVDQLKIYNGDYVDVYIDTDRNANTGCLGDEYVLQANGVTDPSPDTFKVGKCTSGDTFNFGISQTSFAAEFNESTRQAIFLFTPKTIGGATRFNYSAYTFWVPSADPNGDYHDKAPDSGRYGFALDQVKISCTSVFGHLVRDPGWRGVSSGGKLTLTSLRMRGVPAGATVVFRSGSVTETVRAGASGVAQSRRLLRRALSPGTAITVRVTKDTCSTTVTLRVNKAANDLVRS